MAIDRASPDDLMALAADRGRGVPMQLGVLVQLDPVQAPEASAVLALLAARCLTVPRLTQVLVPTALGAGRPIWVDDAAFGTERHLEVRQLCSSSDASDPSVASDASAALAELVLRRLPRDRPLWQGCVLADERGLAVGCVIVLHHALTDGVGGLSVLAALLDGDASALAPIGRTGPGPRPSTGAVLREAWTHRARSLLGLPDAVRHSRSGARELGLGRLRMAGRTSLLAPTGPARGLEVVEVPLAPVVAAGARRSATVNELVLVAVSGALRELLASREESLDAVVVSVPVSGHDADDGGAPGNAVGVLPVRIPLDPDGEVRLAAVQAARPRLHGAGRRGASARLLSPVFRALAATSLFPHFVRHQRLVHTFVTNVRGPTAPLHLAGALVTRVVPAAVNPGNVTVSFDVLSVAGALVVSVVYDPDHVPDHALLARYLRRELLAVSH